METHLVIAGIFAITLLLAFFEDTIKDSHKLLLLAVYAVVFILMATTKSVEGTADALNYEERFEGNDAPLTELLTEPTFIYLSRLVQWMGGGIMVIFFIYALLSIPGKLAVLQKMTPYIFSALLIYVPVYFELHDMVQIRVAAAAMFLLLAVHCIVERKLLWAVLLMVAAILFHYSAAAFLPFLFIGNRRFNRFWRFVVACLVPIGFAMFFLKKDFFSLIPSFITEGKIDYYKEAAETGNWDELTAPHKNPYFMAKCLVLYLCLYYYDFIVERNKYAPILISIFAASILFLLSMATIPVLGGRVSDLYGIVDCIVFTFCIYLVTPRYAAKAAIAVVGLYMLVHNMFFTEYFT